MEYNVSPNKKKTNRKRSALLCCRGRIEIKCVLSYCSRGTSSRSKIMWFYIQKTCSSIIFSIHNNISKFRKLVCNKHENTYSFLEYVFKNVP